MNKVKNALELALEALKEGDWYIGQLEIIVYSSDDDGIHGNRAKVQEAIKACEEALNHCEDNLGMVKQEQGEPVAWMSKYDVGFYKSEFGDTPTVPLYTTPQQRTWVDLTPEEISDIAVNNPPEVHKFAKAIADALKKKNNG